MPQVARMKASKTTRRGWVGALGATGLAAAGTASVKASIVRNSKTLERNMVTSVKRKGSYSPILSESAEADQTSHLLAGPAALDVYR